MTMTPPRTQTSIQWTVVQAGLWVGKVNGEFAGMIEALSSGGFLATTRLAQNRGVYATVDDAIASFTE